MLIHILKTHCVNFLVYSFGYNICLGKGGPLVIVSIIAQKRKKKKYCRKQKPFTFFIDCCISIFCSYMTACPCRAACSRKEGVGLQCAITPPDAAQNYTLKL